MIVLNMSLKSGDLPETIRKHLWCLNNMNESGLCQTLY